MSSDGIDVERSDAGEFLLRRLPPWMPSDARSGNFKFLDVVGKAIDDLDQDIKAVANATSVRNAESVEQIEANAEIFPLPAKPNENIEKYRTRTLVEFKKLTNEATADEIINNVADLLNISPEEISYSRPQHGVVELRVPNGAYQDLGFAASEFESIVQSLIAAGFTLDLFTDGGFTHTDVQAYNNDNHDPDEAYGDLSSDGDGKEGVGGGYAGLIT